MSNPIETMTGCGALAGRNAIFLDQFNYAFGESLFEEQQIPRRIDFMLDGQFASTGFDLVKIDTTGDHPRIADPTGGYRNLQLSLVYNEGFDIYSIQQVGHDLEWNFRSQGGIEADRPCKAFLDPYLTRAAANLIVFTTNILGFKKKP